MGDVGSILIHSRFRFWNQQIIERTVKNSRENLIDELDRCCIFEYCISLNISHRNPDLTEMNEQSELRKTLEPRSNNKKQLPVVPFLCHFH